MNELNNFLSNFETRIDADGNEVLKPEIDFDNPTTDEMVSAEIWMDATKVIKLPTIIGFIKSKDIISVIGLESSAHQRWLLEEIESLNVYQLQKPTIEMFVQWKDGEVLEEPDKEDFIFESHLELVGNPKEYNEEEYNQACEQFQAAQSKVQFFGWEVYESKMIGITISNGEDIATFRPDGTVLVFGAHKSKCDTIDDLNREVQLLMIVK